MASTPETTTNHFVVALDGPAASGKSTVGGGVARALGLFYFDTGLLYRALTWLALERGIDPLDAKRLVELLRHARLTVEHQYDRDPRVLADGRDIASRLHLPQVDAGVSAVSAHAPVREALVPIQRGVIQAPGVVMAGRDIGTVIVPDAPLKIWLNASPEERARRRAAQTGRPYAAVLEGMVRRDELDASRQAAPMLPAADAIALDTDGLSPQAVIDRIVALARERLVATA